MASFAGSAWVQRSIVDAVLDTPATKNGETPRSSAGGALAVELRSWDEATRAALSACTDDESAAALLLEERLPRALPTVGAVARESARTSGLASGAAAELQRSLLDDWLRPAYGRAVCYYAAAKAGCDARFRPDVVEALFLEADYAAVDALCEALRCFCAKPAARRAVLSFLLVRLFPGEQEGGTELRALLWGVGAKTSASAAEGGRESQQGSLDALLALAVRGEGEEDTGWEKTFACAALMSLGAHCTAVPSAKDGSALSPLQIAAEEDGLLFGYMVRRLVADESARTAERLGWGGKARGGGGGHLTAPSSPVSARRPAAKLGHEARLRDELDGLQRELAQMKSEISESLLLFGHLIGCRTDASAPDGAASHLTPLAAFAQRQAATAGAAMGSAVVAATIDDDDSDEDDDNFVHASSTGGDEAAPPGDDEREEASVRDEEAAAAAVPNADAPDQPAAVTKEPTPEASKPARPSEEVADRDSVSQSLPSAYGHEKGDVFSSDGEDMDGDGIDDDDL